MTERMPCVIYVFARCAFALGFTEFVTNGLVSTISLTCTPVLTRWARR